MTDDLHMADCFWLAHQLIAKKKTFFVLAAMFFLSLGVHI
jgi:hypothetical protein